MYKDAMISISGFFREKDKLVRMTRALKKGHRKVEILLKYYFHPFIQLQSFDYLESACEVTLFFFREER